MSHITAESKERKKIFTQTTADIIIQTSAEKRNQQSNTLSFEEICHSLPPQLQIIIKEGISEELTDEEIKEAYEECEQIPDLIASNKLEIVLLTAIGISTKPSIKKNVLKKLLKHQQFIKLGKEIAEQKDNAEIKPQQTQRAFESKTSESKEQVLSLAKMCQWELADNLGKIKPSSSPTYQRVNLRMITNKVHDAKTEIIKDWASTISIEASVRHTECLNKIIEKIQQREDDLEETHKELAKFVKNIKSRILYNEKKIFRLGVLFAGLSLIGFLQIFFTGQLSIELPLCLIGIFCLLMVLVMVKWSDKNIHYLTPNERKIAHGLLCLFENNFFTTLNMQNALNWILKAERCDIFYFCKALENDVNQIKNSGKVEFEAMKEMGTSLYQWLSGENVIIPLIDEKRGTKPIQTTQTTPLRKENSSRFFNDSATPLLADVQDEGRGLGFG